MNNLSNSIDSIIKPVLSNPYLMTVLKLTLTMYAAQLAPRLPDYISVWFQNTIVKILAIFLIVYLADKDFQLAILLAIIFVFGSNFLAGRKFFESFAPFDPTAKGDGKHTLIEPKTVLYPGCQDITLDDLLKAFDNDNLKLQNAVNYSYRELIAQSTGKSAKGNLMRIAHAIGLEYNKDILKEENAPYIATLLMYNGFTFGDQCVPPN